MKYSKPSNSELDGFGFDVVVVLVFSFIFFFFSQRKALNY